MAKFQLNAITGQLDLVGDGGSSTVSTDTFRIADSTDPTKQIAFDASEISPNTTRTIIMPDEDVDLGKVNTALQADGSVPATGDLDMNGHKIVNLASPTLGGDAVNLTYANATYVPETAVGAANGVASLDSGGKVPLAQLPNGVFLYKGTWDPTTNTPTLIDGTGTQGWVYWVSAAFIGPIIGLNHPSMINFQIGDLVIYNGTQWELTTPAAGVSSVNGQTGAVTVNAINQITGDLAAGPASGSQSVAGTLATVNSNVGSFGSSTAIPSFTVNGKGLVIAASTNVVIAPAGTLTGTTLASNVVSSSLTSVGTITSGTWNGTTIDIAHGGTNSATTLNNNRVMVSTAGAIVEASAITASRALASDVNGLPVASLTTATELGFVNGVTSSIQTQLNAKASATAGDIDTTSFSGANNQGAAANVTGLAFANGSIRSFSAIVSVTVSATGSLYEAFRLDGIQKGASWEMSVSSVGDSSLVLFSITTAGQVQYVSGNYSGFSSLTMKFRAQVLPV